MATGLQNSSILLNAIVNPSDLKHQPGSYALPSVTPTTVTVNTEENVDSARVIRCNLNYDTLPTILFYCLPSRTQRLIGHRVKKSQCPLFVLVTSLHGQWCLVQLTDSEETGDQVDPGPDSVQSGTGLKYTQYGVIPDEANDREVDYQSERIAALRVNLDDQSLVDFSDSGASFHFTVMPGENAWRCPFCGASFSLDNSDALSDMLSQHLRLHVELRCCMDCATVLPNNTLNMTMDSQPEHKCSQLVSSLHKDQTTKSNISLQFNTTSLLLSPSKSDPSRPTPPTKNVIPIRIQNPHHSLVEGKKTTPNCTSSGVSSVPHDRPVYTVVINSDKFSGSRIKSNELTSATVTPVDGTFVSTNPSKVSECQRCNLQFRTSAQYQQHMKNVHRGNRFVCQECDVSFSTKGNLTTHFQQVHNRSTAMRCPVCEKRLSNKYNIERHMRFVHGTNHPTHQNSLEDQSGTSLTVSQAAQSESSHVQAPVRPLELNGPVSDGDVSSHANKTTDLETSRGFYLYLSTPDHSDAVATGNSENPTGCLVAEVQMTPCQPNNPNAQFGSGGTTWRPCVRVAEPWLVNSTNSGQLNSSSDCSPST